MNLTNENLRDQTDAQTRANRDAAIVLQARSDPRAFAPLYQYYVNRVYRYARARIRDEGIAEDIVSDTMLAALERLDSFDPLRGSFASWLMSIASHQIVDRQRRQSRFQRIVERLSVSNEVDNDPLTTVVRNDDEQYLLTLLESLSSQDREIVILRYGAGLSSREIGIVVGLSANTTRVRLMRILQRLAAEMRKGNDRRSW